jgi:predicted ATPase
MLKSVRLVNFKAFKDLSVALRPLTLLTGLNGMGKSSILQALLFLRQNYGIQTIKTPDIRLNGDLIQFGTWNDVLFDQAEEDEFGIELNYLDVLQSFAFQFSSDKNVSSDKNAIVDISVVNKNFIDDCIVFTKNFQYIAAERLGPRKISDISSTDDIGKYGEYAMYQLHKLRDEKIDERLIHPRLITDDGSNDRLLDNIEAWLGEISPSIRMSVDYFEKFDSVQSRFAYVRDRDVSNSYRATNVGFGITYVLPILLAILSARPNSLILLENPEAHLHPRGQAKMGELLARASEVGVQIICETHSDHILNGIRVATKQSLTQPENIIIHHFSVEEMTRTHYEIFVDAEGGISPWPEGFFDEFEKMLFKLL